MCSSIGVNLQEFAHMIGNTNLFDLSLAAT